MNESADDTIAAIATAPGEGSVAIVRISGPETYRIADEVFRGPGLRPSRRPPYTFAHGAVRAEDGTVLDEVLMLFMRAPRSYTRQDVVEIQSHGGGVAARRILRRVIGAGARPAGPGEFTRRAFLSGRIDLLQAEAVLDVIRSRSERAAVAAEEQLAGRLSRRFDALYDRILAVAADLEATLDFPDDEVPPAIFSELAARLRGIHGDTGDLIATWDEGHLLRDGAVVVISGRPNAGKSTLLNALLGTDRAITSSTPGTTRDSIEEGLVLEGIPVRLIDTAGLRETGCAIEQEGIRRTEKHVETSDGQIFITDASLHPDEQELALIHGLDPGRSILVRNKTDLGDLSPGVAFGRLPVVEASLVTGAGVAEIRAAVARLLQGNRELSARPHAVISERHRALLTDTGAELERALHLLDAEADESLLAAAALREALDRIGEATGRVYHDELLDRIFSEFCIGK